MKVEVIESCQHGVPRDVHCDGCAYEVEQSTHATIDRLTRERDEATQAKDAAVRLWNECGEDLLAMTRERDELAGEVRRYRDQLERAALALDNAGAMVDDWAGYASSYFREKHDLDGDLLQLRTSAEDIRVLLAHPKPAKPDDGTAKPEGK